MYFISKLMYWNRIMYMFFEVEVARIFQALSVKEDPTYYFFFVIIILLLKQFEVS